MLHITKQELRLYFRGSYQSAAGEVKPPVGLCQTPRKDGREGRFNRSRLIADHNSGAWKIGLVRPIFWFGYSGM